MSHTYSSILLHCVWSTKERRNLITRETDGRLHAYMGGIAAEHGFTLMESGGTENHVHLLLSIPPRLAPAKAVQLIKGGSSKWARESLPVGRDFAWQEGYGVFSLSISTLPVTVAYIRNQKEHHKTRSFEAEYRAFLKAHMIECEDEHTFG